jgi:hypothetical protein
VLVDKYAVMGRDNHAALSINGGTAVQDGAF